MPHSQTLPVKPTANWLHKFYLIVDNSQWLERFLPLGLKLVQLRIKDLPASTLAAEISKAKALCAHRRRHSRKQAQHTQCHTGESVLPPGRGGYSRGKLAEWEAGLVGR